MKNKTVSSPLLELCSYSSLHRFRSPTLVDEPGIRTTEWWKRKEAIKFVPFPSTPWSKLLISDLLRGSNSYISEAKNAEATHTTINAAYSEHKANNILPWKRRRYVHRER
jgi:hypothetical protein